MQRGRLLIIIGIILGLATLTAISFFLTDASNRLDDESRYRSQLGYSIIELESPKYDCWVIEAEGIPRSRAITGGCFKK